MTAQKPLNINDPISNSETFSRELRAKLLSCTTVPGAPRPGPPRGLRGLAAVPVGGGRARTSTRTPDRRPPRGLRGLAAVPVGGGRARTSTRTPDRRPTRGLRGLADTTQHRRRRRCGGRRQGQGGPRDRPLRAKLACGDLAGGPPPTGTHSGPAHSGKPRGGRKSGGPQQAVPRAAAAQ